MSADRSIDTAELRTIALGHRDLPEVTVDIRRHPRARHVRLHVEDGGTVRASIPRRFALHRLDAIVRERADWLAENLRNATHAVRATEVDLAAGGPVRLRGQWYPVRIVTGGRARGRIVHADTSPAVELTVPAGKDPYDVLERWYRQEARETLTERIEYWSAQFALEYGAVSIRDQRTRWGSCSWDGDLSFNWRLVLAPGWVLDSIVVHELCHIEEHNHSDAFWNLVHTRYPRHDEASDWLKEHGPALRFTRPAATPSPFDVSGDEGAAAPRFVRGSSTATDSQQSLF
jgi:predicted metal-dependent hydrolase